MKLGLVVMAAGASSRFGGDKLAARLDERVAKLVSALDARFHLINTFQLGDVSRPNSLRDESDLHLGALPVFLLHIIYYILLGFYCETKGKGRV